MAPWAFLKVNYVPMTLGIVFSTGLVLCYVIAVLRNDVTPYVPFISETGGKYPEAGLFSIFLYLSTTLALATMFVRYLIVSELNKGIDRSMDILNKAAIVIGFIAFMGMVVVAAYPVTTNSTAHGIGANVLFLGGVIYAILQTLLSYRMTPAYNGYLICRIRLLISMLTAVTLITMTVLVPIAYSEWATGKQDHWSGAKVPSDPGFGYMVGSAVAEWCMAIFFLAYYFTFIREFSKIIFHLRVQLLVTHFDEDPQDINSALATERTPMVFKD